MKETLRIFLVLSIMAVPHVWGETSAILAQDGENGSIANVDGSSVDAGNPVRKSAGKPAESRSAASAVAPANNSTTADAASESIENPAEAMPLEMPENGTFQFPMLRALGGMGLVLCLMIGLYIGVRKYAPRFFPQAVSAKNLKIVETLNMGDRRSVVLVQAGNKRFLLGSTPQQISLLATLDEAFSHISAPVAAPSPEPKANGKKDFVAPFRRLFEVEKKRSAPVAVLPDEIRSKMRRLHDALEQ